MTISSHAEVGAVVDQRVQQGDERLGPFQPEPLGGLVLAGEELLEPLGGESWNSRPLASAGGMFGWLSIGSMRCMSHSRWALSEMLVYSTPIVPQ